MIKSMTGFARSEASGDYGSLICELRSVNHRYLELSLRLPEELRALENRLRELAVKQLARGKLDCTLRYRAEGGAVAKLVLNEELATSLVTGAHNIEQMMNNPARVNAFDVMRWPGVVQEAVRDVTPVQEAAIEVFDKAVGELVEIRQREGERLQEFILQRCESMRTQIAAVQQRRSEVMQAIKDKLVAKLRELEVELDHHRLEQELVYLSQKLDVEEELDRLVTHLDEITQVLERNEPVGRRLDFLMQELNREANTLSSKAADIDTTKAAVELKVLIEQMREQVQNIE